MREEDEGIANDGSLNLETCRAMTGVQTRQAPVAAVSRVLPLRFQKHSGLAYRQTSLVTACLDVYDSEL